MRSQRSHVIRRRGAVVLIGSLIASAVAPTARAAPADVPLGFSEGAWDGLMAFSTGFEITDTEGTAAGSGTFDLRVVGGDIVEGTFELEGRGGALNTGDSLVVGAVLDVKVTGAVTGLAEVPVFDPGGASFSGSALAAGVEVPIEFAVGSDDLTDVNIAILSASCEVVVGDWTQHLPDVAAALGGSVFGLSGDWIATRRAPGEPVDAGLGAALADLHAEATLLVNQLTGTPPVLDAPGFEELMRRATELAFAIPRNEACGGAADGVFQSLLAGSVIALLNAFVSAAIEGIDWTAIQIIRAVSMGVHSGILGQGSTYPGASDLEAQLTAVVVGAVQDADTIGDTSTLFNLGLAALLLGAEDALALAKEAWLASGGSGPFPGDA